MRLSGVRMTTVYIAVASRDGRRSRRVMRACLGMCTRGVIVTTRYGRVHWAEVQPSMSPACFNAVLFFTIGCCVSYINDDFVLLFAPEP